MTIRAGFPTRRGVLGSLLLAAALGGCATWEPQLVPASVVIEAIHPKQIRVASGRERLDLRQPRIEGDSLVGTDRLGRTSVDVSSIERVWVRRSNPVGALVGIPALITIGLAALIAATWN